LATGLLLAVVSGILLFQRVEPFASEFYLFIWWSYIIAIDAVTYLIQNNSLIISRTREFLIMLPWSVAFWLLFEMVNLRLDNWHYINVASNIWVRWPGYFLAYATVLPGIFETAEVLGCLGLYHRVRCRQRVIAPVRFFAFYGTGILFLALSLAAPRFCFPLIWLAFIFLLEPLNYTHGGLSLLRDWELGKPKNLLLLLTAGLVCGGLWELWNFWAGAKWIYTVPFFDELKIFEMPLAGFLGFPPFAVECYVMYNFISLFRGKRTWLKDNPPQTSYRRLSPRVTLSVAAVMILFFAIGFQVLDRHTVKSFALRPTLSTSKTPSAVLSRETGIIVTNSVPCIVCFADAQANQFWLESRKVLANNTRW